MKSLSMARAIQIKNRKKAEPKATEAVNTVDVSDARAPSSLKSGSIVKAIMAQKMAKGGEVEDLDLNLEEDPEEVSFDDAFLAEEQPEESSIKSRLAQILSR